MRKQFRKHYKYLSIIIVLIFLLQSCTKQSIPLNCKEWGYYDTGVNENRYNMAIWMFETNWFVRKTKSDIIENLPERKPYFIDDTIKTFVIKETSGWNIDHNPRPQAYLRIIFNNSGYVMKAELTEAEQTFEEKIDGKGRIESKNFRIIKSWNHRDNYN